MKYLILTLLFFTKLTYAENWLNHSKIKSGSVEAYSLKADCERISGEKCFDLANYPSTVFSEFDVEVDDTLKPLYSKSEIQSCASIEECDQIHSSKTCSNELETSIKNYELLEVYCSRFLGYEKKLEKTIQLDSQKLSAWQSQEANKATERAREMAIQASIKRIECGKRIIGIIVYRNSLKSLTTAQVGQLNTSYAPIIGLISTGSLITAREAIQAHVPDGTVITEQDKTEALAEADKCINLN